jgi:hypothetical protein
MDWGSIYGRARANPGVLIRAGDHRDDRRHLITPEKVLPDGSGFVFEWADELTYTTERFGDDLGAFDITPLRVMWRPFSNPNRPNPPGPG